MMRHKGFTLVEIMIVVAIIALLAAIAIPNIVRARLNANEGAAMSALRTIATAAESYRAVQTPPGYPTNLTSLSTGSTPNYIPLSFTQGATVQGYVYNLTDSSSTQYAVSCYPSNYQTSGNRTFGIVEDGVLRAADQGTQQSVPPDRATIAGWSAVSGM